MTQDPSISEEQMRIYEGFAEAAYDRMYDTDDGDPKDAYEDACVYLMRAGEMAEALGLEGERERLQERLEHIMAIYTSQFRGPWR